MGIMPKVRKNVDFHPHDTAFSEHVETYAKGRVSVDNPTITDYYEYYGSKRALVERYQEVSGLKYDSARKQVERMLANPNMKLKQETVNRFGALTVNEENVVVTICGWYTYDGVKWEYNCFANVRRPFTAQEMRDIVNTTRVEGNQAGIDKFLQYYGVDGLSLTFAQEDLSISIEAV